MKPHGLNLILKEEILENEKVVNSFISKNALEAWIELSNSKTGKTARFPMRSFVSVFMNKVHGILSGDGGSDTYMTNVVASDAGSLAYHCGMQIGLGNTPVNLSNTTLETQAPASEGSLASLGYGATTFDDPYYVIGTNPANLECIIKRLFSNEAAKSFYINEVGIMGKNLNEAASNAGNELFARDIIYGSGTTEEPINFVTDSDMRVDFKFSIVQGTSGGLMLNFMRLINNLLFRGDPINSTSRIINNQGGLTDYTYGAASKSDTASFAQINGTAAEIYKGIVVGFDDAIGNSDSLNADVITLDDYKVDEFTVSANTISAVTSGNQFSISRTFTNESNNSITLNRVGILGRGTGVGTALDNTEFIMAANLPGGSNITVQPSQTYRVTYTFKI